MGMIVQPLMCGYVWVWLIVFVVRQPDEGWVVQYVFVNSMSSLVGVLLGCTALMRANSPKHPSAAGCLQFAKMEGEEEKVVIGGVREEGEERKARERVHLH